VKYPWVNGGDKVGDSVGSAGQCEISPDAAPVAEAAAPAAADADATADAAAALGAADADAVDGDAAAARPRRSSGYERPQGRPNRQRWSIDPDSNVCRLARMALDVQTLMAKWKAPDGGPLAVRIGLHVVGLCSLTVSTPVLEAPMVSALEATI
jgi:hypothetical protein